MKKVPFLEKIGLFLAVAGNAPLMSLLSSYFLIFYTNVVGLEPAAIATLFLISKIADGISDPVMGFLMDRFPVTKFGKFRPMLIVGTVVCVINYILLWFGAAWSPVGKYVIVYVTYLMLGWTFDIMDIAKNSLIPVMTADSKERNSLSLVSALGSLFGGIIIGVAGPVIVAEATLRNYYVLIFGSMAMTLLFSVLGGIFVKERVTFAGIEAERYSLKEMLSFLRYRPIWSFFLMALILGIGTQLSGSAGTYFYTYIIGDLGIASGITGITMICSLLGMIFAPALATKFGKKRIFILAVAVSAVFTAVRFADIRSLSILYISSIFCGIAGGAVIPLVTSIQADNTTYIQHRTGKRAEAAVASLTSFITKVAQGIGGAIPGYILALFGFIPGQAAQSDHVHIGIVLCALTIPLVITTVGAVIFGKAYNLNEQDIEKMAAQ